MNNIVLAVLQGVVVMAVAPFFSGLGRVIRAKMHNRRGPSIMQDYRDLAKLFARPLHALERLEHGRSVLGEFLQHGSSFL